MNFRLALRSLLKTPLVTTVAVLSLALGIGANAAIFSLFERMLLRSLPVPAPERLVNLRDAGPKSGSISTNLAGDTHWIFSYPMFRDLEGAETDLVAVAGHRTFGANLAYAGDTLSGEGLLVSGGYFEVLGLRPALGRLLQPDDDRTPGAHPVVVLAHSYWRNRFDGRDVLGETLVVNGRPLTIIGVAPRGFKGTTLGSNPEVFVPFAMRGLMRPGWNGFENRRDYWIYAFGRLAPDVSAARAEAALNGVFRPVVQEVELPLQKGSSDSYLERFRAKELALEPGLRGQSDLQSEVRAPLLVLLGVTGFVLLIACANIANLLLVKAAQRSGEIAVRMSVGAQRRQVVGQLLGESFVLATAGGVAGYLVARATLAMIAAILPPQASRAVAFELGAPAWVFLGVLTLVTGLVGLFPALHATREDLATLMKSQQSGRAHGTRAAHRFRAGMVAVQIALAMALLISAGLFTRSLVNVSRVDLGIEVERLATFGLAPELNGYTPVESRNLFERVEAELAAIPGVSSVAASMVPLLSNSNWTSNVTVQGFDADPDTDTHASYNLVGPGFFDTLGIPLLAGRGIEPRDDLGAPKVAVVNETFAEKFQLGRDAVGRRMQVGSGGELDIEIVGLVADTKYSEVKSAVPPLFYLPYRQDEELGLMSFYVRSPGDPGRLLPTLRGAVSRLDPNLPLENLQTMETQVLDNVSIDRMITTLSAAFAVLATVLAAIGLYGVLAYSVAQRTREIGLRMALGADAARVRGLVLRQVGWLTVAGALAGIAGALGVGRAAQSLLYGLDGHDPAVFAIAVAALALVAFTAGFLPARRAARIDPMTALRYE